MAENRVRIIIEGDETQGVQSINRTVTALDALATRGQQAGGTAGTALAGVTSQAVALGQQGTAAVGRVGGGLASLGKQGQQANTTLSGVTSQAVELGGKGKSSVALVGAAMDTLRDKERLVKNETVNVTNTVVALGREGKNTGNALSSSFSQASIAATNSAGAIAAQLNRLLAGYLSLQSAIKAVQTVASMQSLHASFNGIFGDKAAEQFYYVVSTANKYGKSIDEIASSYRKFAAAANYVGIPIHNIQKIFEATTQAITKIGGSSADVAGALLAIQQSLGKDVLASEEFRQQFAERIPGAMKMAADAMGVTTAEFQKMMAAGQIVAKDFWPKLADQMAEFSQGWQESTNTLSAEWERLKNQAARMADTDIGGGTVNLVGWLGLATVTETLKDINDLFDAFSIKFRAMRAEASGQLSPFETWTSSLDELKRKLDALDQQKSTHLASLKEQATDLSKALVDLQMKQVDFAKSKKEADALRQKLRNVEDQIRELTGRTWTVNVVANVDTSGLRKAQAYIQEIIKGTSIAKARTIEAERSNLQNALDKVVTAKADLERRMANPNADAREKSSLERQLAGVNQQIKDANLGFSELAKREKELKLQQIQEGSAVKQYNDSRGGVNSSELSKQTQLNDAHALSIARQKDAYAKLQAGLVDLPTYYHEVSRAQEAENTSVERINKALERSKTKHHGAANAAARYGERTSSALEQARDQYEQLLAQYNGDTLGAKLAAIDRKYERLTSTIRRGMIGAKGATAAANATLEQLAKNRAMEKLIAKTEAWKQSMRDAAAMLSKLGELSGDPKAIYAGRRTSAQLWDAEQQKKINAISDPDERSKRQAELDRVKILEERDARIQAYESVKAVSGTYWQAERERIQDHLDVVRANASDETAYKVYEAQQWDDYNKRILENQVDSAGTAAEMFAAKWALAFGSYKTEAGRARDAWARDADAIITLTDGMTGAISGAFGDAVRDIGNGTFTIQGFWNNMLSRMLDSLADFFAKQVQEILEKFLSDFVSSFVSSFLGSVFGASIAGFATGGTFASSPLPPNQVLTSPTLFSMADSGFQAFATGGLGIAGEAGPEVIMPAVRMTDGNYGVRAKVDGASASNTAAAPNVNVPVKVVTIFDKAMIGDALREPANTRIIVAQMEREGFRRQ